MKKGTSILHYEILDKLGEGGMGVVYKATDTKLDRTVALKFLPPHLTKSKSDQQRFIREAKAAAALNHPGICTIYNVEEHEGRHFIAMEYIDGVTLGNKLRSEELTTATALGYAIRIAGALAGAHEKGIVHRDIKPGNIMVDSKDRIKVMDFGLAKLAGSAPITQTGTTVGTMAYMAPEQIQGRPVDHRADLFSFGVLLFEMLAGQRPFTGQYDAALSYSIVNEDPPALTYLLPDAPQTLSLLISRLLEKDPAKRYSDSQQLASKLNACLDSLPEAVASQVTHTATQNGTGGSGSSSLTINLPSRAGLLTLAGFLVAVVFIGYWLIPESESIEPVDNTIAVLPLESISREPEDIQFTDGIHEELINRLAGIRELTVIGRSSVLGFEPGQRDIQTIGQQLGVSSLMEGTVRRMGDQLRVSVQLIDANSLATLWSGSFDDNIDNVFEIQSRIARQVAEELQASLTTEEQQRLAQRPTENPQAYRLYMQGREYLGSIGNDDNLFAAEDLFQRALDMDPEFAQAWGMLAETYSRIYQFQGLRQEDLQKLEQAAEWALVHGPELPETYLANGLSLYWNHKTQQALTYFEAAVQKFPNDPLLLMLLASTNRRLGNWEEVIEHLKKRVQLIPLDWSSYTQLAWDFLWLRDYEQAMVYTDQAFELFPNEGFVWYNYSYILLSRDGTLDGFEEGWEQMRPLDPAVVVPVVWGDYNTLKRDWEEALRGYRNTASETLWGMNLTTYRTRTQRIAETLDYQGNAELARAHYDQWIDHLLEEMDAVEQGTPEIIRYRIELANAYARIGQVDKATRQMDQASELMRPFRQEGEYWRRFELRRAEFYTLTGQEDLAIKKLEYLLSVPSQVHRNDLRIHPKWDPLRDNPRFQELIAGEDEPYLEGL